MGLVAAFATRSGDEPAAIPAAFGALLAALLAALAAILLIRDWPVPTHRVLYALDADPPPALRPVRYRHVSVGPGDTIRFEGREVTLAALRAAARRANLDDPASGYFLDVHPEGRWEAVLEAMAALRRTAPADVRLPHSRPYDASAAP